MPKSSAATSERTSRRRIAGERLVRPAQPHTSAAEPRDAKPRGAKPRVPRRGRPRRAWRGPSNLVLAVLALVTAAVVAAAAYFAVPAWQDRAVERAQQTAPSVAERAVRAILSYDYTSLDHDELVAASYLTPRYRKKYEHTFTLVKHSAPGLKAEVTARVLGSGISEADPDRAHVLVFVDQTTKSTANGGRPQVALNRVMLDMVRQDGRWLVDGITSY